jgi:hypothetical protein
MSHEHWLRSVGGAVAARRRAMPEAAITERERLILVLWLTADSMRRAGDLTYARDTCPTYRAEGAQAAFTLHLPLASAVFSGSEGRWSGAFSSW